MIYLILILGFLTRIIGLNQSLWLDEAVSANVAKNLNPIEIINTFSPGDFHPPLYYLFLNIWGKLFGYSVISLRIPSVLFSLTTAFFVYKLGRLLKDNQTGYWSAAFVLFNPLFFYYSQEVRMYQMAVMFLTVGVYFYIKLLKNNQPKAGDLIIFNLVSFLSFLTFYGSIFFIAAMGLYLLFKRKVKLFVLSNLGILLAIAAISPLLIKQLQNSKNMLNEVSNWSSVLGKANLKNTLLIPLKFSIGRISFYPKIFYYLTGTVWSAILFGLTLKGFIKNKLLGLLFFLPLLLGFGFSIFSPLMQYFRFLYLIPILSIGLSLGIKSFRLKAAVLTILLIFSGVYILNPNFHRENWKELAGHLNQNQEIYIIGTVADPIKYYRPDVQILDLKSAVPNSKDITVIPYAEYIHGLDHRSILNNQKYQMTEQVNYREVTLERWTLTE